MSLCEYEQQQRDERRIQRYLKDSKLSKSKSLANFDFSCCPTLEPATVLNLSQDSSWLKRGENLLIIDDIGYVQKSEAETSVLFELIAHRYEVKSLLITSNHVFSDWDSIFADSTMAVAAIDRLVHHAVILEIKADSFRQKAAQNRSSHSDLTRGQLNCRFSVKVIDI